MPVGPGDGEGQRVGGDVGQDRGKQAAGLDPEPPEADAGHRGSQHGADDRTDRDAAARAVEHALDVPEAEEHRHHADRPRCREPATKQAEQRAPEGELLEHDGAEGDGDQDLEDHGGRADVDPAVVESRGGRRQGTADEQHHADDGEHRAAIGQAAQQAAALEPEASPAKATKEAEADEHHRHGEAGWDPVALGDQR